MAPRKNLLASFLREGAFHPDVIAHIEQQTRDIHEDAIRRGPAGGTWKVLQADIKRSDGGIQTFLAKYVIALQSDGSYEGAVADWAHQMLIVFGNIIKSAKVHELLGLPI